MIAIMSEELIKQIVARAGQPRELEAGRYLFHQGDHVRFVHVIMEGVVELVRYQDNGTAIILQRAGRGDFLAEASVYSPRYHCSALASATSGAAAKIHAWPKPLFLRKLREDASFAELWARHLAREVQSARYRVEIVSRRTVAERLDGWLAWHDCVLPEKGEWKNIAAQIGVTPEALYRELAKRRGDKKQGVQAPCDSPPTLKRSSPMRKDRQMAASCAVKLKKS
jgi:CRP-like cAMP-binding protein